MTENSEKQLLHLVFGGELTSVEDVTFRDLSKLEIVGIYPNYAAPTRPGRRARSKRSTMRKCATSSSTCTASSIRAPSEPMP